MNIKNSIKYYIGLVLKIIVAIIFAFLSYILYGYIILISSGFIDYTTIFAFLLLNTLISVLIFKTTLFKDFAIIFFMINLLLSLYLIFINFNIIF